MTHRYTAPLALALLTPATLAWAQGASAATPATDPAWRHCAAQPDSAARLACFDQWAGQQAWQAPPAQASATPAGVPSTTPASAQPSALNSATALDSAQDEASYLCGAGPLRTFVRINLPSLAPALTSVALLGIIAGLQVFEPILILGGPAFMKR